MKQQGEFTMTLDLGDIGEHDAHVVWSGYRARVQREDDYDEMDIERVTIDIGGQVIDVASMLTDFALDNIKDSAWARFPTEEDVASDRADYLNDLAREAA